MQNNEISIKFPSVLPLFYLEDKFSNAFDCHIFTLLGFFGWALFPLTKKIQFVSLKPEISAIF